MAGIVADGAALGQRCPGQPGSQALGGPADRILVEPVRPNAHDAAHSGGAELKLRAEGALDGVGISGHGGQLRRQVIRQALRPPKGILFVCVHIALPP